MFWELKDIGRIRKKLGLSQTQFARRCGVSQSLIAKIEKGHTEPSYRNAVKIFNAILNAIQEKGKRARDVMHKPIIYVSPNDTIEKAAEVMRKNDFSQIPVFENGKNIGSVSEDSFLKILGKNAKRKKVEEIMEPAFPTVDENMPLKCVVSLLQFRKAVLVQKKGNFIGIITKYDVIDPELFSMWL